MAGVSPEQLQRVKASLERTGDRLQDSGDSRHFSSYDSLISSCIRLDEAFPGRLLCSFVVPPHLLNTGKFLHGGASASLVDIIGSAVILTTGVLTTGVTLEISVSYLDSAYLNEEIEIEAKVLRIGKAIAVVNVELRKKGNGKIVATGRHTKYLAVSSRL
ncbi:Acyl-coenzyme A thioesterase 13 [Nymphaea thermarum]|nr:Acyl-coenzyme A thioesterase 13 [Nymphaea thermarum]